MAKRSSDPRVAYPEVKIQVSDLVPVVDTVVPLPHGGQYPSRIRCIMPQGIKGTGDPQQRYATGESGKFSDGTVWGL